MPDITMCEGKDCPLKETCYRYTAKPSEFRQSYFAEVPFNKEEKKCDHFWGENQEAIWNQLKDIVNGKK